MNREVVYIWIRDCRHLGFLDGRNPTLRMEDEYGDIGLVAKAVDSCTDHFSQYMLSGSFVDVLEH